MAMPLSHIGSFERFSEKLSGLCQEHISSNKAKGFIFIFENPKTQKLRKSGIHNSDRACDELNKIAGSKLTIFYLDGNLGTNSEYASRVDNFNHVFLDKLGFSEKIDLPCLLFFRIHQQEFSDFEAHTLRWVEMGFVFNDIKNIIQDLADRVDSEDMDSPVPFASNTKVKVIKGLKHISIESLKMIVTGVSTTIVGNFWPY